MMCDAAAEENDCSGSSWHIVLLVDSNERSHPRVKTMPRGEIVHHINQAYRSLSDGDNRFHCETRHLMAGDYMWIARKEGFEDRVLDCIIERKTLHDLVSSMSSKSTSCAPLKRMHVQMKKMESTTLKTKIFLLEKSDKDAASLARFTQRSLLCKAMNLAADIQNGNCPGFFYKETTCVNDTVRFLLDQHEVMRKRVQQAYTRAVANPKEGISVDEQMVQLSPFASIGTLQKVNQSICKGLNDATFQYYLDLRRIPRLGDAKARVVMARFPNKVDLQRCMDSDRAIETLTGLEKIGKTMGKHIRDKFARKPPPTTPAAVNKKRAAANVTPETDKSRQGNKRVKADHPASSVHFQNPKRRLGFETHTAEPVSEVLELESCVLGTSSDTTERRRCLFGNGSYTKNARPSCHNYFCDSSSDDDDSLFEPIFPRIRNESANPAFAAPACPIRDVQVDGIEPSGYPEIVNIDEEETKCSSSTLSSNAEVIEID